MKIKYAPIVLSMLTSLTFGQSINCQNQIDFNLCNINGGNEQASPSPAASNAVNGRVGQIPNATVFTPVSNQAPLIEMVKSAPTPVQNEVKIEEFMSGKEEKKIFSCHEMSSIRYWAQNPGNTPGKNLSGGTGVVRGIVDSYGWYEVPFTITDDDGKVITGFGGGSAWRQPTYKNGVFHNWSGWPEDDGKNNKAAGWGWNFAQIGLCENSV